MTGWIKRNPTLQSMFVDVLADYKRIYGTGEGEPFTSDISNISVFCSQDDSLQMVPDNNQNMEEIDDCKPHLEDKGLLESQKSTEQKVPHLEKEIAQKESMIIELKSKYDEAQKKLTARIGQLEKELNTAQLQLSVMAEKIEMKNMLIYDKERTIQILSQGRSSSF